MASKAQNTGMRGVYLAAAEMVRAGLIVSPTSRSAFGADILATDSTCSVAFSVQVKTNAKPVGFWLVGEKAKSLKARSHIYVFVNVRDKDGLHEYYIVPSRVVSSKVKVEERRASTWYAIYRRDIVRYRDRWDLAGGHRPAAT